MKQNQINLPIKAYLIGLLSGIVTYILICSVWGILLSREVLPERYINPLINIGRTIVIFVTALTAGYITKRRKSLLAISAASTMFIAWVAAAVLLLDSIPQGITTTIICAVGGLGTATLLILTKARPKNRGYKKIHYR